MINVTKTYIPAIEDYQKYLVKIWENNIVTNRGPLVSQLEKELCEYHNVDNMLCVANGTLALQLAIRALELKGEIITTPFSYVATTSAILWENCTPVYVDINPTTFCIDCSKIEAAISEKTTAILAVHVYGYPCDVESIQKLADKYNLKVIYDAAHAFGVKIHDKSILKFGDITTMSFHATKLFHTIEGGGIHTKDPAIMSKIELMHRFGHTGDDHIICGINAKSSEFHAAMGLCILTKIEEIISRRNELISLYDTYLSSMNIIRPSIVDGVKYNGAYYPIFLSNEDELFKVRTSLVKAGISTRRYFYPSLNNLPYLSIRQNCEVSESASKRVLCLPLYYDLEENIIKKISEIIKSIL
jgi:dTDP-4-amino-4,6-dideoxygalactose transaminase